MQTVNTVFNVINSRTLVEENVEISGMGQETANFVRSSYPKFSKIVLKGWMVNGKFLKFEV